MKDPYITNKLIACLKVSQKCKEYLNNVDKD